MRDQHPALETLPSMRMARCLSILHGNTWRKVLDGDAMIDLMI